VCTGAEVEMITPGGEVTFVSRMVEESMAIKDRCRFFTSMLGKLSSVISIVDILRGHKINNYGITEFIQGQTRRWAVFWSFSSTRVPDSLARYDGVSLRGSMPLPNTLCQRFHSVRSRSHLEVVLRSVLKDLEEVEAIERPVGAKSDATSSHLLTGDDEVHTVDDTLFAVRAEQETWSRAYRRRQAGLKRSITSQVSAHLLSELPKSAVSSDRTVKDPQLKCVIHAVHVGFQGGGDLLQGDGGQWALVCQWKEGQLRSLFESFWSHVTRRIIEELKD